MTIEAKGNVMVNGYLGGHGNILSKIKIAPICNTVKVTYTCSYYILVSAISMISPNTYFMNVAGRRQNIRRTEQHKGDAHCR